MQHRINIKELIKTNNYIIVCDTNILLNIYRYSPEFTEFAMNCMSMVHKAVILPSTVKMEYLKHHKSEFGAMKKKVSKASNSTKEQINIAKQKVLKNCGTLSLLHYPDIDELSVGLESKFEELNKLLEDFFNERNILELISSSWDSNDLVYEYVENIISNNQCMPSVTQEEIYRICEEGEKRYKQEIPPGFKDAKKKDGVRKYSDLIIWKEILSYAKLLRKNVIFVTDDTKLDWWLESNGGKQFHSQLLDEFESETKMEILPYNSSVFFEMVSESYGVIKSDAVEIALRLTDQEYFNRVHENVFEEVEFNLSISGEKYILSSNIGSEGFDELEISSHEFVSAIQVDRDEENIVYVFKYNVTAQATSFEYFGRDDDTKEIILSPGASHIFEGQIEVEVIRQADIFLDFEADNGFESAEIISGNLDEIEYTPLYDYEEYFEDAYTTCPVCSSQINFQNDGGNGFCTNCTTNI
jgi:hypothetical protein